jgi:uncharacterized protein YndB with AHSA1/START domain
MTLEADADGWIRSHDPDDAAIRADVDGRYGMRFERFVPRPAERIWAVLTTPEHIAEWLGPIVMLDLRVGGLYLFRFGSGGDAKPDDIGGGRIRACDPPRLLAFELNGPGGETVITWAITPEGAGCRLTFTQTGLTPAWFLGGMAGWHGMVDDVAALAAGAPLLFGGAQEPPHSESYMERLRRYQRQLGPLVPGHDVPPPLRHQEPDGLLIPTAGDAWELRFGRFYRMPLERVWAALTEPARLGDWCGGDATVDLRLGGHLAMAREPNAPAERHAIVELDPGARLVLRPESEPASLIRIALYPPSNDFEGMRLHLSQAGIPAIRAADVAAGWHSRIDDLPEAAIAPEPRGASASRAADRAARWRAGRDRYQAQIAQSAGAAG